VGTVRRQLRPQVCAAREDESVSLFDVGHEEFDRFIHVLVGDLEADMAAPQSHSAGRLDSRDESCGLGIVEEDNVARLDQLGQVARAVFEDLFVGLLLFRAQRITVTRVAVELVVQALGDREELGALPEHDPACIDSGVVRVREEAAQHLGDAAAETGRVDVPDGASLEVLDREVGDLADAVELLVHDRAVAFERLRIELDERGLSHQRGPP
jgi:hypothetical protein